MLDNIDRCILLLKAVNEKKLTRNGRNSPLGVMFPEWDSQQIQCLPTSFLPRWMYLLIAKLSEEMLDRPFKAAFKRLAGILGRSRVLRSEDWIELRRTLCLAFCRNPRLLDESAAPHELINPKLGAHINLLLCELECAIAKRGGASRLQKLRRLRKGD